MQVGSPGIIDNNIITIGGSRPGVQIYQPRNNYSDYAFKCDFIPGITPRDKVSKQVMLTDLDTNRVLDVNGEYTVFPADAPTVNENGLNTYGAYTNLCKNSEAVGDGVWGNYGNIITLNADGVASRIQQSEVAGSRVNQTIPGIIASTDYCFSFKAKNNEGSAAKYAVYDLSNMAYIVNKTPFLAQLSNDTYITIEIPFTTPEGCTQIGIYVEKESGEGADYFVKDVQLTKSSYRLPYVKTESTTVSVPQNYSDADKGYKWPIEGDLLDALDGIADGDELFPDIESDSISAWNTNHISISYDTETTNNQTRSLKIVKTGTEPYLVFENIPAGSNIEISGSYFLPTAGGGEAVRIYTAESDFSNFDYIGYIEKDKWVEFKQRISVTQTNPIVGIGVGFNNGDYAFFENLSLKEISPAKGEIQIEWMPMFLAGDLTGNINILSANDESDSFLYFNATNNQIEAYDGTNTAFVACSPVTKTLYTITLKYGDNSGQKMQINVDSTNGNPVTFAGSFPNVDDLSVSWDSTNNGWQAIKSIKILKEPTW